MTGIDWLDIDGWGGHVHMASECGDRHTDEVCDD